MFQHSTTPVYHHATPFHRNSLEGVRLLEPTTHYPPMAVDRPATADREPAAAFGKQSGGMHKNEYYNSQVRGATTASVVTQQEEFGAVPSHLTTCGVAMAPVGAITSHQRTSGVEQSNARTLEGSLDSLTVHEMVAKNQTMTPSIMRMTESGHMIPSDFALPPRQFSNTSRWGPLKRLLLQSL